MFIPFITQSATKKLYRRKGGGGGGGKGGGSSGGKGGGSSSSSGGKSSGSSSKGGSSSGGSGGGTTKSVPISGSTGGKSSATSYGSGGGKSVSIPSGSLFAGRTQGGGTRSQVYGGRSYGSGYPGVSSSRGVGGFGFPFYFWPVVWGGAAGAGGSAYLHTSEYGSPNNSSRPGGAMTQANFVSNSTNTTFHLLADNSTVTSLISSIDTNCSSSLSSSSSYAAYAYNDSNPASPQPESAVQYYRASSVVLTLDGYNNTAADSSDPNAPNTPLPTNIDTTLLNCLNSTIGQAVPLVDGAMSMTGPGMGALGLFWVVWFVLGNAL